MEAPLLVKRTAGRASSLFRRMFLALLYSHVDDASADPGCVNQLIPQFTPINAQVHDVAYYMCLGLLKMQTAALQGSGS